MPCPWSLQSQGSHTDLSLPVSPCADPGAALLTWAVVTCYTCASHFRVGLWDSKDCPVLLIALGTVPRNASRMMLICLLAQQMWFKPKILLTCLMTLDANLSVSVSSSIK